jgi:hypothetical protein
LYECFSNPVGCDGGLVGQSSGSIIAATVVMLVHGAFLSF